MPTHFPVSLLMRRSPSAVLTVQIFLPVTQHTPADERRYEEQRRAEHESGNRTVTLHPARNPVEIGL